MIVFTALLVGLVAGWAFTRGHQGRLRHGLMAGLLGAGVAGLVAAIAGDEPLVGGVVGLAAAALIARLLGAGPYGPADAIPSRPWAMPAAILASLLLLRLGTCLGGSLPLAPDEAQYWDWSRSPALAYYSKPGLIAWLIAGWSRLVGSDLVDLRLLGLALASGAIALTWCAAKAATGERATAWQCTALAAILPLHACTAGLLVTDVPLAVCWAGFLALLLRTPAFGGARAWWQAPALGLVLAVGINAKIAMLYAPLAVLLAAPALPGLRRWLRTPAPWLALAIGLTGAIPVLLWNAGHGWVGFLHLAGQSGVGKPFAPRLGRVLAYLGGQVATGLPASLLLPWAVRWAWRERASRPAAWLLAVAAMVPLAVVLLDSLLAKVQPNWAAMAWMPAAVLVGWHLATAVPRWLRGVALGGALAAVLLALAVSAGPALRERFPTAPPTGPERKFTGWDELADAVARAHEAQPEQTITLTESYDVAAELAWHNRRLPRPLCASFGRRMSQYDLWDRLDAARAGCDAVFVMELDRERPIAGDLLGRLPNGLRADFADADPPEVVRIERGGRLWQAFLVVRLHRFDGVLDSAKPFTVW